MSPSLESRQYVVNSSDRAPEWSADGAAFTGLLMRVFPLERRLSAAGEVLAGTAGQTMARWMVLEAIDRSPATVAEIGRSLGLARQGVQRLADLLADDGLVVYLDNPRHARAKLVALTDAGAQALRTIQRAQREWSNRLGGRLGQAELAGAAVVIDAMLAAVTADMPTPDAGATGGPEA